MSKIALAADHAGYEFKDALASYLREKGYDVIDLGTNSSDSVDYPVYAKKLCSSVLSGECEKGILVCGTGIGMSIAANRHKGIRAALCTIPEYARLAREHNNANVLCLGARFVGFDEAVKITDVFLNTKFLGGRHLNRVNQLDT